MFTVDRINKYVAWMSEPISYFVVIDPTTNLPVPDGSKNMTFSHESQADRWAERLNALNNAT